MTDAHPDTATAGQELHLGENGLWIPPELRDFDQQIVFRTPRSTIQHRGGISLDPYYGLIDESHFGPEDEFTDPNNPELAPNRVSIKREGEDPEVFPVEFDPDVRV